MIVVVNCENKVIIPNDLFYYDSRLGCIMGLNAYEVKLQKCRDKDLKIDPRSPFE